ncbi:hypothetical protein G7D34_003697 [Salmonella enterica]|nr:hypothetical protein [Salmonella enterica]
MNFGNFSLFDDSYDPTKSNVLGENLAPTAGYSNELPALDFSNDTRTAQDWKEQARQANIDANPNPDIDDDSMYTSTAGNRYKKVNNSRADQVLAAVGAFLSTDIATGNGGAAAQAAGKAVYNLEGQAKRFSQIDKLEATGRYNTIDIDKWIETGDNADLTRNAGKWQNMGNGMEANTLTGESRQIPGYQVQTKLRQVNLGDRVAFVDANGNEVKSIQRGAAPKAGAVGVEGGSIGLDDIEAQDNSGYQFENGQWVQHTTDAHGRPQTKVAGVQMQKLLNEQQSAGQQNPQQAQMSKDLSTLTTAANSGQVDTFTGLKSNLPDTAINLYNQTQGTPQERDAYNAANRIDGYMQNQGVGAAKEMGLSGINTIDEAKRAFASMPRLDRSSSAALARSITDINNYVQNFNAQKARSAGATPAAQQPAAAPAGGAIQVKRDANGKLIIGG